MASGFPIQWTDDMDAEIRKVGNGALSYTGLARKWDLNVKSVSDRAIEIGHTITYWTPYEISHILEAV